MKATTNLTRAGTQQTFEKMVCSSLEVSGLQQQSIYMSVINIFLSVTAFLGNSVILVALHKESYLHPPSKLFYRCLATTDLLVGLISQPLTATYWMTLVHEHWNLCRCIHKAVVLTSYTLCLVSLSTMTAISVDRLLALLLGLRYKQIVTLKRTYITAGTFCAVSSILALCFALDYRITFWFGRVLMSSCLLISIGLCTKIFHTLSNHQAQVQDNVQQQPSQLNALNMARYRKAVYSALWVQLALVVCYAPYIILQFVIGYSSHLVVMWGTATILVYFNSTLNPFLYCWKISEVRLAVKQTIREALSL